MDNLVLEVKKMVDYKDAVVMAEFLKIKGEKIRGQISPFDMPKEILTRFDNDGITHSFKYLTSESLKEKVFKNSRSKIRLYFGKNSGKLYSIKVEGYWTALDFFNEVMDKEVSTLVGKNSFECISNILNFKSVQNIVNKEAVLK